MVHKSLIFDSAIAKHFHRCTELKCVAIVFVAKRYGVENFRDKNHDGKALESAFLVCVCVDVCGASAGAHKLVRCKSECTDIL